MRFAWLLLAAACGGKMIGDSGCFQSGDEIFLTICK